MPEVSPYERTRREQSSVEVRIAKETRALAESGDFAAARDHLAALRSLVLPGMFPECDSPLELEAGRDILRTGNGDSPLGLSFTSDSRALAWTNPNGTGSIVDLYQNSSLASRAWSIARHLNDGEEVRSVSFHDPESFSLVATNHRVFLLSSSAPGPETIWDDDEISTGRTVVAHTGDLLAFSRSEQAGKERNTVHVHGNVDGRWKRLHTHEGTRGEKGRLEMLGLAARDRQLLLKTHSQLFAMPFEARYGKTPRPEEIHTFDGPDPLFLGANRACDKLLFDGANGSATLIGYQDSVDRAVVLRQVRKPWPICCAALSPDATEVAFGAPDGRIEVSRLGSFTRASKDTTVARGSVNGNIRSLHFSSCGKLLLGQTIVDEMFVVGSNLAARGVGG